MKRIYATTVVVILAWGLAAPVWATMSPLHAKLLKVNQLPSGWLAEGASSTAVFGCPASSFPTHSSAKVSTGFNYGAAKSFPLLTEVLATFKNASTAYAALTAGINGCGHVSGTQNGHTFSGSVSKMSFPQFGTQSAAFGGHFTMGGSPLVVDIVVVRKNNEVMELEEGNFTSITASSFRGFASAAAAKL